MSNDTLVAIIVAVLGGGVGVKVIEGLFSLRPAAVSEAAQIRAELRQDIAALRVEAKERDARIDILERRDALKSRIILALLTELHRLAPDWQPGAELAADLAKLETD